MPFKYRGVKVRNHRKKETIPSMRGGLLSPGRGIHCLRKSCIQIGGEGERVDSKLLNFHPVQEKKKASGVNGGKRKKEKRGSPSIKTAFVPGGIASKEKKKKKERKGDSRRSQM